MGSILGPAIESRVDIKAGVSGRLRHWQRVTILLLTVGYAGFYLCRSNLAVATPSLQQEIARDTGKTPEQAAIEIGGFVSLGTIAYALGKFLGGGLGDVLGGRPNFLIGMGGAIGFTCLFAMGRGLPVWSLAWIGNRFVQSLGWPGIVRLSSRWFSYTAYGGVMAIVSLSYLFGDAIAKWFMGRVLESGLDWRAMYYVDAAVLGLILIANVVWLRESPGSHQLEEPSASPDSLFQTQAAKGSRVSWRSLIIPLVTNPMLIIVCVLSAGMTFLREVINNWGNSYYVDVLKMSTSEAADASALFPLFGGISVLVAGFLSDRMGRGGRALLILLGLVSSGVLLWVLSATGPSMGRVLPVCLIALLAFVLIGPYAFLAGAIALDLGGKGASARVAGVIDGLGYLVGGVLAGQGVAHLRVHMGWSGMFLTMALVSAISAGLALLYWTHMAFGPRVPTAEAAT